MKMARREAGCLVKSRQDRREMSAESNQREADEAPEEVTFSSAREAAERNIKAALEIVRREKALLKEKRRRKEQLFKEQKKRKLLPDNILEAITSVSDKNDQTHDSSKEGEGCDSMQHPEEDSGLEGDVEECLDTRWKESYMAIRLKDQGQKSQQIENAKAFINFRLYGPGSRRSSVNEYFSVANKKAEKKKAAMLFVNKS
ncbi:nucleolar protein 7 [Stegostoma tigrinum]|uniref:nucleolar protein 7 n=1 Tax=Stegostoma tigrinum TaxID=3053191 RepID=UPI00202B973A|nr:nucleolar protein 7 [Stegostoma tigrinum]XP_048377517.1 nucleolar protein 7 [Stegostoma tigrinum]XP_059509567.1 nucleolar protein 7 [Stegostoma tigrinum]